jgi:hypothetical protein
MFLKTNLFGACKDNMLIFQKDLSKGVLHAPIIDHLTLALKGFVVGNQIINLTPNPSFDHNSCILYLNEQCNNILGIYISRPF